MDAIDTLERGEIEREKNYSKQKGNTKTQLSASTAQRVQEIRIAITAVEVHRIRINLSLTALLVRKETITTVASLVTSSLYVARKLPMTSDARTTLGINLTAIKVANHGRT